MPKKKIHPEPGRVRKAWLRQQIFIRDGWLQGDAWMVMCAFGCGDILVIGTATLDHYPLKQRDGGSWNLDNLRLACRPCNSADCNHKEKAKNNPSQRLVKIQERKSLRRARRIAEGRPTKDDLQYIDRIADQDYGIEKKKVHKAGGNSPSYRKEIRKKLHENYPKSEGRDRNGLQLDVIWDAGKQKFRYDK